MPGSDGPENLKILKKSQLGVDCGPCRQTIELLALRQRMEFSAIELSSDYSVEKLSSDHGVEKLGSDNNVEKLGSDHDVEIGPRDVPSVGVSMIRKIFKNFEEMKSEVNKCVRT